MKPEDVPDEMVDMAWRADLARRAPGASAEEITAFCEQSPLSESYRAAAAEALRPVLAAVLPAHEAAIRAKVAAEIEAESDRCGDGSLWDGGMDTAARIARGETDA